MKENLKSVKTSDNPGFKNSYADFILNLFIFVLAAAVIFLSYSLYRKIDAANRQNTAAASSVKKTSYLQVEVLNGCGISGVADKITDYLRKQNFDVVQMGNYISFDVERSMVIDRAGNMENALKIAESLGIDKKRVVQQVNGNYFLDASVVIGKDFNSLKPYK